MQPGKLRILITGGAGFIGSHLTDRLMAQGHHVTVLDNFFTGSKENVKSWIHNENFQLVDWDVTKPIFIEVDQIYHLACPASPFHYQRDPIFTTTTNFLGTMNMLDIAAKTGARFLLTSTSEVYGDPEVHPQTEEYWGHVNPIGKRSCYDEGKRIAETLSFDYHREKKVEIRIARIFNTFGPRMNVNDGRVVSNFIVQLLQGKDITIYGTGNQTRSFCFVSDLVEGLIRLMNKENVTGPYNLGSPREISIRQLALLLADIVNVKQNKQRHINFVEEKLPSDDPSRRQPNIDKAKRELDWSPIVPVETGLGLTVDYFRNLLGL